MMHAEWILDANQTHLDMREFPLPPTEKKNSKNWHLWPGYVTPDHYQSSARQPIALGECRERCKNQESRTKRHSQETRWLRSKTTFMVPALKPCMQQICLYYRGRELQAQRRDDQQTHIWKGCCSICTALYSFFRCVMSNTWSCPEHSRHDFKKKITFTYFLLGVV